MPPARKGEIAELKKLILNIQTQSEKEWSKIQDVSKIRKMEEIQEIPLLNIKTSHLMEILKSHSLKLQKKYRIFLPPLDDDQNFLPLLTFECNNSAIGHSYKFCLDLVKDRPHILSLRFEKETSDGGEGDHNYVHVQINNRIDDFDDAYELNWLPDHNPHILMRSDEYPNSPIILIIYLLSCLYGFKTFTKDVLDGVNPTYFMDFKQYQ